MDTIRPRTLCDPLFALRMLDTARRNGSWGTSVMPTQAIRLMILSRGDRVSRVRRSAFMNPPMSADDDWPGVEADAGGCAGLGSASVHRDVSTHRGFRGADHLVGGFTSMSRGAEKGSG